LFVLEGGSLFGNGIRTCRKITEKNKKKGYGKKKREEGRGERDKNRQRERDKENRIKRKTNGHHVYNAYCYMYNI